MGSIPGSVSFTGFVAPTDSTDTYPVIDPLWGIDGLRSVADVTTMNAISTGRRREGMLVYTQTPLALWRLKSDLSTWELYGLPSYATFVLGYNSTDVTTGTDKTNHYIIPRNCNFAKAFATAKTGPVGSNLVFDIKKNGTSLWSVNTGNRLAIVAGQTKGTQTSFDTTTGSEGDELSIDVVSVGSTTAGQNITVQLLMLS